MEHGHHFATLPSYGPPPLTAPRVCQLCGRGFVNWKALVRHCDKEHGNHNEYRKRVFWEAQRLPALPLPTVRKRNMIANATSAILYTRAGGDGEPEERREEACVVCARKGWLEHRHRCYLWKVFPEGDAEEKRLNPSHPSTIRGKKKKREKKKTQEVRRR